MKKITALILLLVLLFTVAACAKDDGTPDGMKNVSTQSVPFNLYVPNEWFSTSVSGISGAKVSESGDQSNVTVTAYYSDVNLAISNYWDQECVPRYTAYFKNFMMINDRCGDEILGGRDAKKYVFCYTLDDTVYQCMQVITAEPSSGGQMFYILTYTATSDKYESHLEDVNGIVKAFTFR